MSSRKTSRRSHALLWAALALAPVAAAVAAPSRQSAAGRRQLVAKATPAAAPHSTVRTPQSSTLRYNRDIRPILAENCFACHGPDSAARKADLRLDRPADATAAHGSVTPIVKGKPEASEVAKRITGQGPQMPPAATHKKLTAAQIETLKRWIAQGAEYETHWSYIAPTRPPLPAVKDAAWCRNPIDRFILARLEKEGLKPAPEADRRTLARRLSLDLTGLPPDPADVDAFVNDKSADAYEKLVDKFMAMPQWGEHRGRFWLDAARYGDTHGIHIDNYREIWAYRDWVINAFNKNMSFDQFTLEQLAGDLLPNPTLDQLIATGFNRCNITTSEGGAIAEEYLVLYCRDRTEATSQVWLGTTAGCAVCHDHKFDPLTQKEFYSLSAFFNNTTQPAMDGNVKDTPPIITVPLAQDRPRFDLVKAEVQTVKAQRDARKQTARADFEKWVSGANSGAIATSVPTDGLTFHAPLSEGKGREIGATLNGKSIQLTASADPGWQPGQVSAKAFQRRAGATIEVPNAGDREKDQPFTASAWVRLANTNGGGSIIARMDDQHDFRGWDLWVENGRVATHIVNKWPEDALKVVTREALRPGTWQHVTVAYTGEANPGGVRIYIDGVRKDTDAQANALKGSIRTSVPFKIGQRHSTAGLDNTSISDVRLYNRALSDDEALRLVKGTRAAYLAAKGAKLAAAEKDELFDWWLTGQDAEYRKLNAKTAALENEETAIRMRGTIAHVMQEKPEPPTAFVLFRGEYDKHRDQMKAATPAFLPPMSDDLPRNRLGFAKWLLRPEHPLTARVTVNRFWQEIFGSGIVRTPGDFGVTGEQPTHPELLDWMAVEFREGGWDVKKFYKMLVTSATYRQSALTTPEKKLKDPANKLLSRGARYRMDGEMVRDYALAASGELVKKIGGPSVRPYQPEGVWEAVAMIGSNTRDYRRDTGEALYRRSMYTFWKRAAPPASMEIFNAPTREVCTVRRERTNTPLQALVTLNDIQFVEAARALAERALKDGGATDAERIDFMAKRLLARPFSAKEQAIAQKSLAGLESFYKGHAKEAKELITTGDSKPDAALEPEKLAAWTMLANQLMNLDEVLNK